MCYNLVVMAGKDQHTVKNTTDIEWLKNTVTRIESKVEDGFKGVYIRQDTANHQTAKNTTSIKWLWVVLSGAIGAGAYAVIYLLEFIL